MSDAKDKRIAATRNVIEALIAEVVDMRDTYPHLHKSREATDAAITEANASLASEIVQNRLVDKRLRDDRDTAWKELKEARAELAERDADLRGAVNPACDEVHCACVAPLRVEVDRLKDELDKQALTFESCNRARQSAEDNLDVSNELLDLSNEENNEVRCLLIEHAELYLSNNPMPSPESLMGRTIKALSNKAP